MDDPFADLVPGQDKPQEAQTPFDDLVPKPDPAKIELKSSETWGEIANRWSQGMAHKMLRGITLGASDRFLPELPEETKQNITEFEQEHPVVSGAAEVAGGLTGGVGAAKSMARYAPRVSQWITRKIPLWAQMATGGAASGGIYAANLAEEGERAKEGVKGAVVGAVAGPVLGTAMNLSAKVGKETWGVIKRMLANTDEKQAESILRRAMDAEDLTPEFIQGELDRLGPEAVLADVSPGLARTARGAAALDYNAHGIATGFLMGRQAGQVGRVAQAAGGDGFDPEQFARGFSKWLNSRKSAAGPQYKEAFEATLQPTDRLVSIMNRPSVKSAMDVAAKDLAEEGVEINDVMFFQAVKERLDDRIGEAYRAGRRNEARRLTNTKNALLEEIDNQVPVYKEARDIFAGERQLRDSAEMGYEVVTKPSKDLWIVEESLAAMSDSEQYAFRQGALRGVIDKLDKAGSGRNVAGPMIDSNRAKQILRMIFPDEESFAKFVQTADAESVFSQTKNTVLGGSPTSRIDADKAVIGNAANIAEAARRGTDMVALALRFFKSIGVNEPSPEALRVVNETLMSRYANVAQRAAQRAPAQGGLMQSLPAAEGGAIAGENIREGVQE